MNGQAARPGKTRLMALGLTSLVVLIVSAGAVSLALFIDQETVPATFTSGTIILDAGKIDALTLTNANMMPGDSMTGSVDVENDGLNELAYSLITSSTSVAGPSGGVLNTVLTVEVRAVDGDATVKCDAFDGAVIDASEVLGATNTLFGDPSPTVNVADRVVAPGATDVLCIRVSLPPSAPDTMQAATTTTTFTFDAEQTENN